MSISRKFMTVLGLITACGAPGLPPAGPPPGNVEIGYGSRPAEKVTGAVTSLSEERIGPPRPVQLEDMLRGRVPGLHIINGPRGTTTLRIRGTNSLLYDKEPLLVVDGVQMSVAHARTALSGLTTDDIRQIDVLKDVASTSIYGSPGAGGVILITTRR